MHAFLFVGGTNQIREDEMIKSAKKYGSLFEFPLQKISDVKDLADFTKYSQSTKIAILIRNIDKATKEALNAFLKILEEPGDNISYYISCSNEQNLLSTIISRCQVKRVSQTPNYKKNDIVTDFLKLSFGEKIKLLEKYKKREDTIEYLQRLILDAHQRMIHEQVENDRETIIIKSAQKVIKNLNLNANVNLQMTCFAVKTAKHVFTRNK